jgi:adenosylcobinamide kinase / adenosylcobinamide-phosphate guanylyltransferase
MALHLVTGGARSGKSTFAEKLVLSFASPPAMYIATAEPLDDEMHARIALHRSRRQDDQWRTIEVPRSIDVALASAPHAPALMDCLTLLASNVYLERAHHEDALAAVLEEVAAIVGAARSREGEVVVVSNEIGMGLVPETALGRGFRDALGLANQAVAAASATVTLMVSGIPWTIRGAAPAP